MRKNVSGQVVGAQLVDASDGSAITSGTVTVHVTGDGGSQSTGSGTVTHEGNGFWSYAPTQAETNVDHVAFTFTHSSAIPVTVQAYPVAYDPSDATALGLGNLDAAVSSRSTLAQSDILSDATPFAGANVDAAISSRSSHDDPDPDGDIDAAISSRIAAGDSVAASPSAGTVEEALRFVLDRLDVLVSSRSSHSGADVADAVWDEDIEAAHGADASAGLLLRVLGSAISDRANNATLDALLGVPDSAGETVEAGLDAIETDTEDIQGRLPSSLVGGRMDASIGGVQSGAIGSSGFAAGALDAAALATDAGQEIADRILQRNLGLGSDGGRTVQDAMRLLRNRAEIASGTLTVYQEDDSTAAWSGSVTTAAGDPISEIDPT